MPELQEKPQTLAIHELPDASGHLPGGRRVVSMRELMGIANDPAYTEALELVQRESDGELAITRAVRKQCTKDMAMDIHAAIERRRIDLAVRRQKGTFMAG
jgi:hypothetical protein